MAKTPPLPLARQLLQREAVAMQTRRCNERRAKLSQKLNLLLLTLNELMVKTHVRLIIGGYLGEEVNFEQITTKYQNYMEKKQMT